MRSFAKDSLKLRRQGGERAARALVSLVGQELDALAAEHREGMAEHQQLGLDVGAAVPGQRGEPGPADLKRRVLGV